MGLEEACFEMDVYVFVHLLDSQVCESRRQPRDIGAKSGCRAGDGGRSVIHRHVQSG